MSDLGWWTEARQNDILTSWTHLSEQQSFGQRHSGAVRPAGGSQRVETSAQAGTEAPALGCCVPRSLGARFKAKRDSQSPLNRSDPAYYRAHCCLLVSAYYLTRKYVLTTSSCPVVRRGSAAVCLQRIRVNSPRLWKMKSDSLQENSRVQSRSEARLSPWMNPEIIVVLRCISQCLQRL